MNDLVSGAMYCVVLCSLRCAAGRSLRSLSLNVTTTSLADSLALLVERSCSGSGDAKPSTDGEQASSGRHGADGSSDSGTVSSGAGTNELCGMVALESCSLELSCQGDEQTLDPRRIDSVVRAVSRMRRLKQLSLPVWGSVGERAGASLPPAELSLPPSLEWIWVTRWLPTQVCARQRLRRDLFCEPVPFLRSFDCACL